MNNVKFYDIALAQSALECRCRQSDFLDDKSVVFAAQEVAGLRADVARPLVCRLVSYGSNIVACCKPELIEPVSDCLGELHQPYEYFETPRIYRLNELLAPHGARACYQAQFFPLDVDAVFGAGLTCHYELRILGPDDFADLYVPRWSNALCKERPQLDVLGVGAYDHGLLVGLAGCSADCEAMWQIGIDVLGSHRRHGIAATLTNRLARETFERGKVPFYCAAWSNVRSFRNALASGFKPAWVELTARPIAEVEKETLAM